jgi:hypothetical protein
MNLSLHQALTLYQTEKLLNQSFRATLATLHERIKWLEHLNDEYLAALQERGIEPKHNPIGFGGHDETQEEG